MTKSIGPRSPGKPQDEPSLPELVPGVQVDADEESETVTYELYTGETWVNGAAG
jgi:hypothetical protein